MGTHDVNTTEEPKSRFRRWHMPVLVLLAVGAALILLKHQPRPVAYQSDEGLIFGTVYHVKYQYSSSLQAEILETLNEVDASLSMFNPQSTISRINRGETQQTDSLLETVWALSQQVSAATDGAFDPTCAPLVNAWGFGFKHGSLPTSEQVDSLRALVNWRGVTIENHLMSKADERMILDFSAVAKGFGVDQVARMLDAYGVENYMVEIGGEVVTRGMNPKGKPWTIGIAKPVEDSTSVNNELERTFEMNNCAVATSGNYRNFYVRDGRKISHTIDPKSGEPVRHSLLSSTVWAPTCAEADAFATAFMVVGVERAKEILKKHPELNVYFIYEDENKNLTSYSSQEIR